MDENNTNETSSNKVIEYNDNGITFSEPAGKGSRHIAYAKPGDEIHFNFSIDENIRIEVVKGDVHIVFPHNATLTIVSLAALAFGEDAPKIINLDGKQLSVEDFLNKADALDYNEAKLILTNKDSVSYSDTDPDLVQVSTDNEAENEAGIPITGTGDTDTLSDGVPSNIIISNAVSTIQHDYTNSGSFVTTIYTSDNPYLFDKSNLEPGTIEIVESVNLTTTVFYGSNVNSTGNITMEGVDYVHYQYSNGETYTDDKASQVVPNTIDESSSTENIYIDSHSASGQMDYVVELDYVGETRPELIEIVVPKNAVDAGVTIDGYDNTVIDSHYTDTDGSVVYRLSLLDPTGKSYITVSFPENTSTTFFDITYKITFFSASTGQMQQTFVNQSLVITPVTSQDDVLISSGDVLSSVPNPVDVNTGSGDDVVIGGGADNSITTNSGNDSIFTANGNDTIVAGDGNDQIWGAGGSDTLDGGTGEDTLYYNNFNSGLDSTGINFKESYYNTYVSTTGIYVYVGIEDPDSGEGVTTIKTNTGENTILDIENIYLTDYVDYVYVSNFSTFTPFIDAGDGISGDTLFIDEDFNGQATINLKDFTIHDADNNLIITFANFESIKGSSHDDYFYSYYNDDTSADYDYNLDGGEGIDTLDYSLLDSGEGIIFYGFGSVEKGDGHFDYISNFEVVVGTTYDDTFYGSFENSYDFQSGGGADILDYSYSSNAVTLDLSTGNIYKSTDPDNWASANYDTFDNWDNGNNVYLSNSNDVIFGTDNGDFTINAGRGNDTLNYSNLTGGIVVTFDDTAGTGTITKAGGTDTFNIFNDDSSLNVATIVGTNFDDTFYMNKGAGANEVHTIDGGDGSDTLDYSTVSYTGSSGININFAGTSNFVTKDDGGGVDYFSNIENIVGTAGNDEVNFTSNIDSIDTLSGIDIDLGDGNDTANFSAVLLDGPEGIEVSYSGSDMIVNLVTVPPKTVTFHNTESAIGTTYNDILYAVEGIDIGFNGSGGTDIADYSAVNTALVFDLTATSQNVTKGTNTDSISNVEVFYGGTVENTYYASYQFSYTFNGVDGVDDTVSYLNSSQGVTFDLANGLVYKGQSSDNTPLYTDTLINIDFIEASNKNDIFLAYEDSAGGTISLDGLGGVDTIDFSSFTDSANALNLTLTGATNTVEAGGITWELANIEGFIGTTYDDSFTLSGDTGFTIDGNDGYDTVVFNDLATVTFVVTVGSSTTVNKSNDTTVSINTLTNVEDLSLGDGNDSVVFQETYATNSVARIDAKGGDDILDFASISDNLTIDVSTVSGSIALNVDGFSGDKEVEFDNFETIKASQGETIFVISGDVDGITLIGNNASGSSSTVQIGDASTAAVVLTLSSNYAVDDTITGGINATLNMQNIDNIVLTGGDDIVYTSELKNMNFDGGDGSDTLDYSNFTGGASITIDLSSNTVIKKNNAAQYDSFENIETIIGTDYNDTILVTNLAIGSDGINIDLGAGDDTLAFDTDVGLTFDVTAGTVSDGTNSMAIDTFTSVERIQLSDNDDTIILSVGYSTSLSGITVDAGDGADMLDASSYVGEIEFHANTNTIQGDSDSAISIDNVEIIKGSATSNNTFYGSDLASYTYIGGSGSDTLTYEESNLPVTINIGEGTVTIVGITDSYEEINNLVGTSGSDTVIVDDSFLDLDPALVNSLSVNLDTSSTLVAQDIVRFNTTDAVSISIDASGNTTFNIGDSTTDYTIQFVGVDVFALTDNDDHVTIDTGFTESTSINGSSGVDTITYAGNDDIEFDAFTGIVTLNNSATATETLVSIEVIEYTGTGTATIHGGSQGYTYLGNVALDYTNLVSGVVVDFRDSSVSKNGLTDTYNDYFDMDNIVSIKGSAADDVFILAINDTGHEIILDGGNGSNDQVSFESITTDNNEFGNGVPDTGLTNDYTFVNIEGYALTNQKDTYYGYGEGSVLIDGLDDVDTLDYSQATGYSVIIDFTTGTATKTNTTTGDTATDTFSNFEGAVGGDGDDLFILGNGQILGSIDGGAGNNIISFEGVDAYDITVDFTNASFTASFDDGSTTTPENSYTNFHNVTLGKGNDTLNYTYTADDESVAANFIFNASTGGTDTLTLNGSGNTFYITDLGINGYNIAITSGGTNFIQATGFDVIAVDDDDILNVETSGFLSMTFDGGDTVNDVVSYANSSSSITLSVTSISTSGVVVHTSSDLNTTGDTLIDIDTVVLTSNSDTVELTEYTGTETLLTIDAGDGVDTISLGGYANAVTVNLSSGGSFTFAGYSLINFENYELTSQDDTVNAGDAAGFVISGGEGNDTLNFAGATEGVVLYYDQENANQFLVTNAGGQNTFSDFETLILSDNNDILNIQVWNTSSTMPTINIDMGAGSDTVSFASYTGSESLVADISDSSADFIFSDTGTVSNPSYSVTNVEQIIGTINNDTFVYSGNIQDGLIIDGNTGADDVFDAAALTATSGEVDFDLKTGTLTTVDGSMVVSNIDEFYFDEVNFTAAETNASGLSSDYTIHADIINMDYSTFTNGVAVNYGTTVEITADSGAVDTIIYDTQVNLVLTSFDDTLNITEALADGTTIDMGSQTVEDTVDLTAMTDTSTIVVNETGVTLTVGTATSTLKNVERLKLSSQANNLTVDLSNTTATYGYIQLAIDATAGTSDTINLNIATNTTSDVVLYDLTSNTVSSTLAGGGTLALTLTGFETYNSGASNDTILVSQSLENITFNAEEGTDTLDLRNYGTNTNQETYTLSNYDSATGFTVTTSNDISGSATATYTGIDNIILSSDTDIVVIEDSFGDVDTTIDAGGQTVGEEDQLVLNTATDVALVFSQGSMSTGSSTVYKGFESVEISGANTNITLQDNYYGSVNAVVLDSTGTNTLNVASGTGGETTFAVSIDINSATNLDLSMGTIDINFENLDEIILGAGNDVVNVANYAIGGNAIVIDADNGNDTLTSTTDVEISQDVVTQINQNSNTFTNFETISASTITVDTDAFVDSNDGEKITLDSSTIVFSQQSSQTIDFRTSGNERFQASQLYYESSTGDAGDASDDLFLNLILQSVTNLEIHNNDVNLRLTGSNSNYASLQSVSVDAEQNFQVDYSAYSPTDAVHATIGTNSTVLVEAGTTTYSLVGVDELYLSGGTDVITIDSSTSLDSSTSMTIDARGQQGIGGVDTLNLDGVTLTGNEVAVTGGTITVQNFETTNLTSSSKIIINNETGDDGTKYILSDESDTIIINQIDNDVLLWAGDNNDYIIINGDYSVQEIDENTVVIDGITYITGGSYLVVTDEEGNTVYIGDATMDDVVWNTNDTSNSSSSNNNEPVVNDNNLHDDSNSNESLTSTNDDTPIVIDNPTNNNEDHATVLGKLTDYLSKVDHDEFIANHDINLSNIKDLFHESEGKVLDPSSQDESSISLANLVSKAFASNEDNIDSLMNHLDGLANNLPTINLDNLDFNMNHIEESSIAEVTEHFDDSADKIAALQSVLHKHNSNNGNSNI
ncbi:calcium-binding protein [Candidatus Hepatincola sp. Pdp]